VRVLQDFEVDGAEVFGIDIDCARTQRGQHDRGVAQPLAMFGRGERRGGPGDDLAEDERLGEALGADTQDVVGVRQRGGEYQRNGEDGEPAHGFLSTAFQVGWAPVVPLVRPACPRAA
jgi:hypothetical protein